MSCVKKKKMITSKIHLHLKKKCCCLYQIIKVKGSNLEF